MSKEPKFKVEENGDVIHLKSGKITGNIKEGVFTYSEYGNGPGVKRWVNVFVASMAINPSAAAPKDKPNKPVPVSPSMDNTSPVVAEVTPPTDAQILQAARRLGFEVSKQKPQDNPSLARKQPKEYPMGEHGNSEFPGPEVPPMPTKTVELGDKTPEVIAHIKEWFPEEYIVRYDIRGMGKVVRMVEQLDERTGKIEKRPQEKTMLISGRGIPGTAKPNERR